jgi:hypothetical protein
MDFVLFIKNPYGLKSEARCKYLPNQKTLHRRLPELPKINFL